MSEALASNLAFQERLRKCVQLAGGRPNRLAKASGVPITTLLRYFKGSEPARHTLIKLAEAVKVPVGWLVAGIGSSSGPAEVRSFGSGYTKIPWVTGSLRDSKGVRKLIYGAPAWFPSDMFCDLVKGADREGLAMIQMRGNAMEPDIIDGETVVIDTNACQVCEGIVQFVAGPVRDFSACTKSMAVRINKEVTVRDVVQLGPNAYAFRHLRTPVGEEGIRFTADQLGDDVDVLGSIVVALRYPVRTSRAKHTVLSN